MEESLRESEERYRILVELSPDAIYIHSDGKLVFSKRYGAKLLGADRPKIFTAGSPLILCIRTVQEIVRKRIEYGSSA